MDGRASGDWRGAWAAGLLLLALAVTLAMGLFATRAADSTGSTADAEALRALAERLLDAPHLGSTPGLRVQLLPHRLPLGSPLKVPVPPGARLLGSATYAREHTRYMIDVAIDAPAEPGAVLAFYEQALPARGWPRTQDDPSWPIELAGPDGPRWALFRGSTDAHGRYAVLALRVASRLPGHSDVRARLELPAMYASRSQPVACWPGSEPVPRLYTPEGSAVESSLRVGSHDYRWGALEGGVVTPLTADALEAHFAQQLVALGWTRLARTAQRSVAWSRWQLPGDEHWRGVLVVYDAPADARRLVNLRVESEQAPCMPLSPPLLPVAPVPSGSPPPDHR